jgi:hypothetical protein
MSFIKNLLYKTCINIGYYCIMICSYFQLKYNKLLRHNDIAQYVPIWNTDDSMSLEIEYKYNNNRSYKITGTNYNKMKQHINDTLQQLSTQQIPYYKWISAEMIESTEPMDSDKLLSIVKTYAGPYGDFYAHSPELIQTPPNILNNTKILLMDNKLNSYTIDYSYKKDNYYSQFHNKTII